MKATLLHLTSALALLALAGGCSNDLHENETNDVPGLLTFSATVAPMAAVDASGAMTSTPASAATRATVEGNFPDGACIGIFVRKEEATAEKVYVYNSSTRQFTPATPADAIYWQGTPGETKSIRAWYPYPYIQLDTPTTQPADQRSDEAFANADFLTCKANIVRDKPATLTFQHNSSALITVNLSAGTGMSEAALSRATVTFPRFNTNQVKIDKNDLFMTIAPGSAGVTPHKRTPAVSGDMPACDAIVRKYNFGVNDTPELIRVTIDGTDYSYYKPAGSSFSVSEGHHYTYNVRVNHDGLTLVPPTGGTWKPGGEPENIPSTPSNNP